MEHVEYCLPFSLNYTVIIWRVSSVSRFLIFMFFVFWLEGWRNVLFNFGHYLLNLWMFIYEMFCRERKLMEFLVLWTYLELNHRDSHQVWQLQSTLLLDFRNNSSFSVNNSDMMSDWLVKMLCNWSLGKRHSHVVWTHKIHRIGIKSVL